MTITEGILVGALVALFTGLLGIVLGSKKKVTTEEFKEHVNTENPHKACPVHSSLLAEMDKKLDRIDKRVYRLVGGKDEED